MEEKIVLLLIAIVCGPFLIIFFCWCLKDLYWAWSSGAWPSVRGKLIKVNIVNNSDSGGSAWNAKVEYAYPVGGKIHLSDRIGYLGLDFASEKNAKELTSGLVKGQVIDVFYNPHRPEQSALHTGLGRRQIGSAAGSVLLLFIITVLIGQLLRVPGC